MGGNDFARGFARAPTTDVGQTYRPSNDSNLYTEHEQSKKDPVTFPVTASLEVSKSAE
jgi:hypothetical protein